MMVFAVSGNVIGSARVRTLEQSLDAQVDTDLADIVTVLGQLPRSYPASSWRVMKTLLESSS
jgi:hypothetical protein